MKSQYFRVSLFWKKTKIELYFSRLQCIVYRNAVNSSPPIIYIFLEFVSFLALDDYVYYKKIKLLTKLIVTVLHGEKRGCNVNYATLFPWPVFLQKFL